MVIESLRGGSWPLLACRPRREGVECNFASSLWRNNPSAAALSLEAAAAFSRRKAWSSLTDDRAWGERCPRKFRLWREKNRLSLLLPPSASEGSVRSLKGPDD